MLQIYFFLTKNLYLVIVFVTIKNKAMKNILKVTGLLVSALLLFTTSCEKLSDEELLTDHIWRYKSMTTTSTDPNIIALVGFINTLMVNATMDFNEDGTYTLSAMNQTTTGTWELTNDGKTLFIKPSEGEVDEMTVVKLTKEELVLQGEEVDSTYGKYSVTMSWIK